MTPAPTAGPRLRHASDVVLRVGILSIAGVAVVALAWRLRVVVLPIFVAVLLCTALVPPVVALERRGLRPLLATWLVFGGAGLTLAAIGMLVIPPTIREFSEVGTAVTEGLSDIEDWLVDGPLALERSDVERYTRDPSGRIEELAGSSSDAMMAGARTAGELIVGGFLAVVLTFLFLKDGRRMQVSVLGHVSARRRDLVRASAARVWAAFGGFLRGAAILGVVEGVIIGVTMAIVGAPLAIPVAILTFLGAFFPIVGALVIGAVAVLVTLAGAGPVPAAIVLVVAIAVQQLDNDLLAPFIYGRSLDLHPAAVLVALAAGGTLGGIIGAFVAVPIMSASWGVAGEIWNRREDLDRVDTDDSRRGPPAGAAA